MTTKWRDWAYKLINTYDRRLSDYPPKTMDTAEVIDQDYGSGNIPLRHVHWMLELMPQLIMNEQKEAFNTWLGFVQGVFVSFAIYSVDEIQSHYDEKPVHFGFLESMSREYITRMHFDFGGTTERKVQFEDTAKDRYCGLRWDNSYDHLGRPTPILTGMKKVIGIQWHYHEASDMWEAQKDRLRARVKYIHTHSSEYMWGVFECDAEHPLFAHLVPSEYTSIATGDTTGDDAQEGAKKLAEEAFKIALKERRVRTLSSGVV